MAEAADSSHNNPTGRGEEPPERCFNSDTCKFIQKVLDRSRGVIVEGLTRLAEVLDVLRAEEAFGESSHVKIRDLEDTFKNKTTSECNREICDKVRGFPQNYLKLKSALVKTNHKELLATIETKEAECHDELKGTPQGCVCKHKTTCPLLERLKCKTKLPPEKSVQSDQIKALQRDLIKVYKPYCEWENPVTGDDEEIISQMYVKPDVKIRERGDSKTLFEVNRHDGQDESIPLSYRQVFYSKTEPCSNIYITGDAGMGKTTFCKQLLHTWSKAVQGTTESGDSAEDLSVMNGFTFLFYVSLREADKLYHVKDMLEANVLRDVTTDLKVSDILKTEKCLIVLDGLDEWSPPSGASICPRLNKELPGRNTMNENCVYLTSTRNWKFDVINLKSRDVDKYVELCGLGEKSSRVFAKTFVGNLSQMPEIERPISNFYHEVTEKNLTSLASVPILLIKLLTLWYFDKDLGTSQVQLYCKMLDLLFEQKGECLSETKSTVTKPLQPKLTLPACFNNEDASSCLNHTPLLLCLAKLAFMSLVNKEKESSLVFKSSRLDIYGIDESDVSMCLKCGIFTQSKVFGNLTGRFKKYSFLHKNLHEFLAAVYLVTCDTDEDTMSQLKNYCSTLDSTLEMGQVFMFVCGMNAELGKQLLDHLTSFVSEDSRVKMSRCSPNADVIIDTIQSCLMACLAEGTSNGITYDMNLQDFSIDYSNIADFLTYVVDNGYISIKSVYIFTLRCNMDILSIVMKHLQEVKTLEKLYLVSPFHVVPDNLLTLVIDNNRKTLKSLVLGSVDLTSGTMFTTILDCIPSLLVLKMGFESNVGNSNKLIMDEEKLIRHVRELELCDEEQEQEQELGEHGQGQEYQCNSLFEQGSGPNDQGNVVFEQRQLHNDMEQGFLEHGSIQNEQGHGFWELEPEDEQDSLTRRQIMDYMEVLKTFGAGDLGRAGKPACVSVSHAQMEQLLSAQTKHLTHLCLSLYCCDHSGFCMPELNLSAHIQPQLQTLSLESMCITNLSSVSYSVQEVNLTSVTISLNTMTEFINALEQISNKVTVRLFEITLSEDSTEENPTDLVAHIKGSDKLSVIDCDIESDRTWRKVVFEKM